MAKLTIIQTNFNAGELSADLAGHVDLDRYNNGAKVMLNAVPQLAGGAKRRAGSRVIQPTKTTDTTRLIPFVFSKSQAYVLEVGGNYTRFYTLQGQLQNGGTPVEVSTPWAAADVFNVEFAQRSDTMFMAHPATPMKRLLRILQTAWTLGDVPFDPSPIDEIGVRPQQNLTLDAINVGDAGTATSVDSFLPSDVGRNIVADSGVAEIITYTDASHVTYSVVSSFGANAYAANLWKIDQSPLIPITPSNSTPVDGGIALVGDGPALRVSSVSLTGTTMTLATDDPHNLSVGDQIVLSGFESAGLDGLYAVATVPDASHVTFTFNGSLLAGGTLGTAYAYGIGSPWRPGDVGSYVSLNGGLVEITQYVNSTKVFGRIVTELSSPITAPPSGWTLKSPVWNPVDGYPRAVSLYQQRLYAAGSAGFPERFWGSSTGAYFDFTPGTDDADSFQYDASSDQVNQIAHLASSKVLAMFTEGEEFTITGGSGSGITPTNINVQSQSVFGCTTARPVRVANEMIYAQRAGKKIRSMVYDFNTDSFVSQNLTRLAEDVTGPGIIDMAFQAEPNPVVWMVRSDGVLVSMTYDRTDNVCGFARHTTDGLYKSVCVIPGPDADVLFAIVQRTVDGQAVQYVEQFDQTVMTDAAITGTKDTGANVWDGLDLLEGKTCDVKADGVFMGSFTVAGGQITLPRTAKTIEVGLHYASQITTLTPNISGGLGTSQGNQQSTSKVIMRFLETTRCLVDGQVIPFRQFGEDVLDQPPPVFTGDKNISDFGWGTGSEIVIEQDQPYQWHVLAMIRQFTVNNG